MADIQVTVEYNDLKLLNNELNNTQSKVKLTAASASKDFDKLKRSIDPVYHATKTFEAKILTAQKAVATGSINNKEYARTLDLIRKQAAMTGVSINELGQVVSVNANKMNKFGSLGMQQVGYQVGDFLVQVQSGTNWMVAFGQQATQLVGIMGMLNSSLIPLAAVLGIAIPLATAFGAAWLRTRDAAKEAEGSVDDLDDAISSLKGTLETITSPLSELEDRFGRFAAEAVRNARVTLAAEVAMTKNLLSQELSFADETLKKYSRLSGGGTYLSLGVEELRQTFNLTIEQTDKLQAGFDDLVDSSKTLEEKAKTLSVLEGTFSDLGIPLEKIPYDLLRAFVEAGNLNEQVLILKNLLEQAEDPITGGADEAERFANALKEASKAMSDLSSFSAGLDEKIAVAAAQVEALKSGADASVAGTVAKLRLDLQSKIDAAVASGVDLGIVEAQYGGERAKISTLENLLTEKGTLSSTGKGSTAKSPTEQLNEYMISLEREAALRRVAVGETEEYVRMLELEEEYKKRGLEVDYERIDNLVKLETETRKLTEAENYRENMIQSFSDKMETALMSIVDGSATVEDAFKSMLRGILLEIYQQQVAKPVASFFGNMLFGGANANGNAFLGGNVIPFANGGVVGSPTFFPMANGMGLMGEAGPEAIMPLKRGPDGKLGVQGGGQTVINQTINVSTGVQQTVRNEIKTLMPQIAEQSKNAVLDAKRRGGSYGKRFA